MTPGPFGRGLARLGCRLLPAHDVDPAEVLRFERDERAYSRGWMDDHFHDFGAPITIEPPR